MTLKCGTVETVAAASSKVGAKMTVNLGLCVGAGYRVRELWMGFRLFRSAKKGFGLNCRRVGRSGIANSLARDRDSLYSTNLHEWKFMPLPRQSRCRDAVDRLQDLSCTALGGRKISNFAGYISIGKSRQQLLWPSCNHRSEESPRISSSSHQHGPADDMDPPPLFMGNQLKRFSHFRDGIVHWCRYLEVKKDVRNHGQAVLLRDEEYSLLGGAQIAHDPGGAAAVDASSHLTVICFDIETTGFSTTNDRIIEFAARDLAGGVCSTIETLVNPEREVKNEHAHNISTRMVNNAGVPKWKDVALALVDFVECRRRGHGQVMLVAHNGKRFDVPFIMNEFHECGISIPSYWRFADSMALAKLAMKVSGRSPLPKTALGHLFNYYNLPSVGKAHRAMADVNMLAQVLQMLMNDLEMSAEELLEQSFSPNDIVLKGKDPLPSKREIVNSSGVVAKAELGSRGLLGAVNDSGSISVPWDLISEDCAGRSNEDNIEAIGLKFGEVWERSSQQFPSQDEGTSFQVLGLGGVELEPNKEIMNEHNKRAGATPLMRSPPSVVRTPAIRLKRSNVKRDIKTVEDHGF